MQINIADRWLQINVFQWEKVSAEQMLTEICIQISMFKKNIMSQLYQKFFFLIIIVINSYNTIKLKHFLN